MTATKPLSTANQTPATIAAQNKTNVALNEIKSLGVTTDAATVKKDVDTFVKSYLNNAALTNVSALQHDSHAELISSNEARKGIASALSEAGITPEGINEALAAALPPSDAPVVQNTEEAQSAQAPNGGLAKSDVDAINQIAQSQSKAKDYLASLQGK